MATSINDLTDDIISHILSFLSIRDTLRARLTSPRWLNIPDSRSVILLNEPSVLGKILYTDWSLAMQSKFIKIANRFMQLWSGNRTDTLEIRYMVDEELFEEIEEWVAKAFRMKIKHLDISVAIILKKQFIFPCTAIQPEYEPHLKSLYLVNCTPSFLDFGYTNWLSNLTSLRLMHVPLDPERMNLIFSSAANLVALDLFMCGITELRIDGQLLSLKELNIGDNLMEISLNCPSLEEFKYNGQGQLYSLWFVHVPVLREAHFLSRYTDNLCSILFNDINIQARSLEALSITVPTEITTIPPNLARHSLKKLDINLLKGFDLLSIKYLLNACPCLEELGVKLLRNYGSNHGIGVIRRIEYWDQREHHKLKKVKFSGFLENWNAMKLAKYIMRNAVVLEEMKILTGATRVGLDYSSIPARRFGQDYFRSLWILKEEVNPTARLIISHDFSN